MGKPSLENLEKNKIKFFEKAYEKHGVSFDYSKFEYVNAKTHSIIICKIHGEFIQCPDKHLNSKYACPRCNSEQKPLYLKKADKKIVPPPPLAASDFEVRFFKRHPNKGFTLDMSNYISRSKGEVVLECPLHGKINYKPNSLLISRYGCRLCGIQSQIQTRRKSFEQFVLDSKLKHDNKYTYLDSHGFLNRKSKVTVICSKHGAFVKSAQKHLSGQGCFDCRLIQMISDGTLCGGYNEKLFQRNPDIANQIASIYYIKVGDFYKIGITTNMYNRMKSIKSMSKKSIEIIDVYELNLYGAYKIEQKILKLNKEHRLKLDFSKELFSKDVLNSKKLQDFV